MRKIALLLTVFAIAGVSAQQAPPPPNVSNFFNDFTAEWVRGNPNLAASTRCSRLCKVSRTNCAPLVV